MKALNESICNLSIFDVQIRRRTTSGEIRWSHLRSAPRRLEDDRIIWDEVEVDITDLKQAEEALRNSEERWQLALKGN
ncbi:MULTISPECIES: hypothetical protein [Fischerella]|nr:MULTISPECIES: hypothetical protein [Fischerella]MBD2433602.1 hypothetical protein [Fischerella sp. FACHB-380]